MSKRIQLNDGTSMTVNSMNRIVKDINTIRNYWHDGYSVGFNINSIFNNEMSSMSVPTDNPLKSFIEDSTTPSDEEWNIITHDYYYLIGGVNRESDKPSSGVAIRKDRDTDIAYVILFTDTVYGDYETKYAEFRTGITAGVGSGSNADVIMYLIDEWYFNGGAYTPTNGLGRQVIFTPFNVEFFSVGPDDTPLYDVVAEQYCDMVALNATNSLMDGLVRKCPSLILPNPLSSNAVPYWMNNEIEHDGQDDGGDSAEGGGDGITLESVDIDFPELPPSILLASGIVKMFSPSVTQMNNFVNFIYSAPDQLITNFKKLWANPMDSIISLALSPIAITTDGAEEIKFCGVGSNVYANVIKDQYMTLDCGYVKVPPLNNGYFPEEYKTLLDYSSYTKVKCFLPFFGFFDMETDEVTGAMIHIKYNIDLLTGEALAVVKCTKEKVINNDVKIKYNSCLYQFKGNIISQVPLTGNNYQQLYSGVINLVTAVALPNPATVAGVAKDLLGQKVTTQHGGSLTGNGGALGEYTPYLIVTKPIRHKPQGFGAGFGYPSDLGQYTFSQYKGYLEVDTTALRLNDIENITDVEIDMLKNILETGIVINERG